MSALAGKTAVVTGASQGIGKAIALELAERGTNVMLTGRSPEKLEQVVSTIRASGGVATIEALDLLEPASIERLGHTIRDAADKLDILVNCGGVYARGELDRSSTPQLKDLLEANVLGVQALTLELLPVLEHARGDIVFVNSSIVYSDGRGAGSFAATQHALRSIADTMRAEYNAKGVRILSVFPGRTATPRQEDIFSAENRPYEPSRLLQANDIAKIVAASLELGETAEVTDLRIRPRFA